MAIDKRTIGALFALMNSAESAREALAGVRSDVSAARTAGASWAEIGSIVGLTAEAARVKFGEGTPVVVRATPVAMAV